MWSSLCRGTLPQKTGKSTGGPGEKRPLRGERGKTDEQGDLPLPACSHLMSQENKRTKTLTSSADGPKQAELLVYL